MILLALGPIVASNKALAASPEHITLPSPPITFQSAPGSEIAASYCLICHSAEYVYMQPPHSPTQWNKIVKKMKHAFGCPIPDKHISALVDYLVSQNTIQPTPKRKVVKEEISIQQNGNGNPQNGKILFNTHCTNCHGTQGKGDGPIGQSLIPPAADLTATGNKSDKQLLQVIRKGRPGTAMPSWKGDLSDGEIYDALSYIRTLSP
ncbi:MAG: cytochrome c [Nitrospirales bacterium]